MANMFGALNRFISRLDSDPGTQPNNTTTQSSTTPGYGFQVLRNTTPSLPLEPYFDFIIGINSRTLDNSSPDLFATELRNCAGATISLGVFCAKGQVVRETYITVPPAGESLGLSLQWAPLSSGEHVWHILDVMANSPADVAGLLPYGDYVLGSPDAPVLHDLGDLVEEFMDRDLRLWVYNHEYDVTRLVTLTPSKSWGGEGALGCVLGYGALHRIPAPLTEPAQQPGETLFESGQEAYPPSTNELANQQQQGQEFLVPANMAFAPAVSPPPPPPGGKAKKPPRPTAPGLDDYFAEGEQKSREIDKPSTPKAGGAGLPPPPPKGGPPKAASPAPATVESEGDDKGGIESAA